MFSSRTSLFRLTIGVIALLSFLQHVNAAVQYCSGLNTASTNKNSSIYQSNGLCSDFCRSNYAFAIVQDDGCWCSNFAPGTTTDGCTQECRGYPSELCGAPGKYGYIALARAASGTRGGAASSSSPRPVPSTSSSPPTSAQPTISATSTLEDTETSSSTSPSSTWTPTPVTSLETITGQVRTVTVTPTIPPNPNATTNPPNINAVSSGSSGLSTGGAVGLTIGLVALVALISAIIFFCIKKRRKQKAAEAYSNGSRRGSSAGLGLGGPTPSRTMSEHSRYVLGTNGREVVETWEPDQETPGSRKSRLMPVDPRLNPFAPVYRSENKSRESVNTLRDDHDYSRRVHQSGPILRATNPDE